MAKRRVTMWVNPQFKHQVKLQAVKLNKQIIDLRFEDLMKEDDDRKKKKKGFSFI